MIFFRRGVKPVDRLAKGEAEGSEYDFEDKINFSVFPSLQGGPHNHQIGALACALKWAATPKFREYQEQVVRNSRALGAALVAKGYNLVTGGTDNHLILWDLRPEGVTGSKMEKACDLCHITLNKNAVVGDVSAMTPGGVRIGAPAMTSRGLGEGDFKQIAAFLHEVLEECKAVQASSGKMLKDFVVGIEASDVIKDIRARVEAWADGFDMPGHGEEGL
jgi:glycine hydroxymethyltransferase